MMQTRAQRDLILAEELVSRVESEQDETRRIYGGLCHSFPVLVRASGLCQALAFSKHKVAGSDAQEHGVRARAHALLLEHVGRVLGSPGGDPLETVRKADVVQYMFYTRRILSTWAYFKRFAASILKVTDARAGEEGE
jgi:CRISPR-associated protein Cmr5